MSHLHTEPAGYATAEVDRLTLTGGEVIGRTLSAYGVSVY